MSLQVIKGAANGGTAFEPLKPDDRVLDQDGETWIFDRYGINGWFGFFTREGSTVEQKLPLAGLRIIDGKSA